MWWLSGESLFFFSLNFDFDSPLFVIRTESSEKESQPGFLLGFPGERSVYWWASQSKLDQNGNASILGLNPFETSMANSFKLSRTSHATIWAWQHSVTFLAVLHDKIWHFGTFHRLFQTTASASKDCCNALHSSFCRCSWVIPMSIFPSCTLLLLSYPHTHTCLYTSPFFMELCSQTKT